MKPLHPNQVLGTAKVDDLPYDPKAPIKKTARVEKIKGRPEDIHKIGDKGTTVGAFKNKDEWCYYVQFDANNVAVSELGEFPMIIGIMGFKIKELPNDNG